MFKALVPDENDEGIILVRGVPFGSPSNRDVHGQYFTQNTNYLSHILPLPPIFHFHGAKSGSLADQIGETQSREQRGDGVWYRARLFIDSANEAVRTKATQLWEAAKAGLLFASSGAVEATIKVAATGEILQWLVGELSLIDTRNNRENPASFHATVVPVKMGEYDVEVGSVTLDNLNISTKQQGEGDDDHDDKGDHSGNGRRRRSEKRVIPELIDDFIATMRESYDNDDEMHDSMLSIFRRMFGNDYIPSTRSANMPDENNNNELLVTMQQQVADMTAQLGNLQGQVTQQAAQLQERDNTIATLQTAVSTKSAEVAMGTHSSMVDAWIAEGKITPAEKDYVLEVLSFAFQADTTAKNDGGFVNAIKGWVESRPITPVIGTPSAVYSNLNGSGITEGPGGGVDQANIARLARYAEVTLPTG